MYRLTAGCSSQELRSPQSLPPASPGLAVADSHWVAPAFWYSSLMTSVCGILIGAQQISLLVLVGDLPEDPHAPSRKRMERHLSQLLIPRSAGGTSETGDAALEWQRSWKQIFTWQVPLMFVAYSFLFYFIGLTTVVCAPLINWTGMGPGDLCECAGCFLWD